MQNHTRCLIQACQRLNIPYQIIGKAQHCIQVNIAGQWRLFSSNRTPFNSEAIADICRDKKHTYDLLCSKIPMPKTESFLDPQVEAQYAKYLYHHDMQAILSEITKHFNYPIVIKPNRGALGCNVNLCHSSSQTESAINAIFSHQSRHYDYLALAQEYIPTAQEYRFVCFKQQPLLLYKRCNHAITNFNVRYWENGYAEHSQDAILIEELREFIAPVFAAIDLVYVGFDIVKTTNGEWMLLELNSAPRYDHFIEQYGDEFVITAYQRMLEITASLC